MTSSVASDTRHVRKGLLDAGVSLEQPTAKKPAGEEVLQEEGARISNGTQTKSNAADKKEVEEEDEEEEDEEEEDDDEESGDDIGEDTAEATRQLKGECTSNPGHGDDMDDFDIQDWVAPEEQVGWADPRDNSGLMRSA